MSSFNDLFMTFFGGSQSTAYTILKQYSDAGIDASDLLSYISGNEYWGSPRFHGVGGTPTQATLGSTTANRATVWNLGASESVGATRTWPTSWGVYSVYYWWSNAGAGAGDVNLEFDYHEFGDTDSSNSNNAGSAVTVTAPVQYTVKRTLVRSNITITANKLHRMTCLRSSDPASALANDISLYGVEFVRVS